MQDSYWVRLPDPVREVLAWADASEPSGQVGSRGLLIGIMLAHGRENEVDQLLRHFGVSRRKFFQGLQAVRTEVTLAPDVHEPSVLTGPPRMTHNAEAVMQRVDALAGRDGEIGVQHVFGAILEESDS